MFKDTLVRIGQEGTNIISSWNENEGHGRAPPIIKSEEGEFSSVEIIFNAIVLNICVHV